MSTEGPRQVHEAPAKINLALRVRGRRRDGYHELDTLFLPLDLADEVLVELTETGGHARSVRCCCPGHGELDGGRNLAARAARAYLDRAGIVGVEVSIEITKHIWQAAGLGGGSSDAATTLLALERRYGAFGQGALGREALAELALSLGADVPYFLAPVVARGRGVGERLTPLTTRLPRIQLVLVNPGQPLSTAAVFGRLGLEPGEALGGAETGPALDLSDLPAEPSARELAGVVTNDLAEPAMALCPAIGPMLAALEETGALAAGLSGSGPTVFGLFDDPRLATAARAKIARSSGYRTRITAGPRRLTPIEGSPI